MKRRRAAIALRTATATASKQAFNESFNVKALSATVQFAVPERVEPLVEVLVEPGQVIQVSV